MSQNWLDRKVLPIARYLDDGPMSRLGIRNTMRLARAYNGMLRGKYASYRRAVRRDELDVLMHENGRSGGSINQINDGWAIDTSGSLPHLRELLDEADAVIREPRAKAEPDGRYRAFFRNILVPGDLERCPSFLNFICSSDVVATVSEYLGFIPCLSRTVPAGVRFTESWMGHDAAADQPPTNRRATASSATWTPTCSLRSW